MTATHSPAVVHLHGHHLVLHPERALELPDAGLLIVADLHWGKATALRAQGVPIPSGGTANDLRRLDAVLERTDARELCILGDLAHSRHGWDARALVPVYEWRARWPSLAITLVRGNHDRHAGDPPASLDIACVDGPYAHHRLQLTHEPIVPSRAALHVFGHLHPTARLVGRGGDRVRLPCFVLGSQHLILPAFSSFTGAGAWVPSPGERVFGVVEDAVVPLPSG
jgi:DNA ligase-associated metallophosphoesterase